MQRRSYFVRIFLIFFVIAFIIFISAKNNLMGGVTGILEAITIPIQQSIFGMSHKDTAPKTPIEKLQEENKQLLTELSNMKNIQDENNALKDQFKTNQIISKNLLPAHILGTDRDTLIIDKGRNDGVKIGNIAVVENNFAGKVSKVTAHISVINTVTDTNLTFTAKDQQSGALGVGRGESNEGILFDLVDLSDKLSNSDLIETKGDIQGSGNGIPPGLIVGRIISINKKTSSIFQSADVESLINFMKLNTIFIMSSE